MPKSIHRWLGLILCFTVLCISVTGVLLLWKKEYLWWSIPEARQSLHNDPKSLAMAIETIEASYLPGEIRSVQLQSEDLALHKVFLSEKRTAWHNREGQKLQVWSGNQRWEDFILDLHHRFLLGNTIGLNIAGFSGLLVLPLVLLGGFIWWPRRRSINQGFWPGRFARSALIRSHGNIGAASILPILILAFSGVVLVYPNQATSVLVKPFASVQQATKQTPSSEQQFRDWNAILSKALLDFPRAQIRWVSPPSEYSDSRIIGLQQQHDWNRSGHTMLYFNLETGKLQKTNNALAHPLAQRFYNFQYPLHTGKLGLWYRLLMSLFGVAVTLLCIFGFSSYLKR